MANEWANRPINSGYTVIDGATTGYYNNNNPSALVKTWAEYKVTQSAADLLANQSRIDIKLYSQAITGASSSGMSKYTTARDFGHAGWDNANRSTYSCVYDFNNFALNTFFDGELVVPHNADGTKTITLQAGYTTMSQAITGGTAEASVTLPTIAQKTTFDSVSGLKFGFPTTVQLNRKASNLTDRVTLSIGSQIVKETTNPATSFTFTLARSYAPATALPCALTGTLTVETFNGATSIGTVTQSVTFEVASDDSEFFPTLTTNPSVEAVNTIASALGTDTAVADYSKIKVTSPTSDLSLKYGATIAQRYVLFTDGTTVSSTSASSFTSDVIHSAGDFYWYYVVVDSRGFSVSVGNYVTIINSSAPKINPLSVWRGDSSGNVDENGTYIYVEGTASYDSLNGHNSATMTASLDGGTPVTLTSGVRVTLTSSASPTSSYSVDVEIEDILRSTTYNYRVPSAVVAFNINTFKNGVAIGQYNDKQNTFQVGFESEFNDDVNILDSDLVLLGLNKNVYVNGSRVLTEADIPIQNDISTESNNVQCYDTIHDTPVTAQVTSAGLYTFEARLDTNGGAMPLELLIIRWNPNETGYGIEQLAHIEANTTLFGDTPLCASGVRTLSSGDTVQIYCRYASASYNNMKLTLHRIK